MFSNIGTAAIIDTNARDRNQTESEKEDAETIDIAENKGLDGALPHFSKRVADGPEGPPWEAISSRIDKFDNDLCMGWNEDINTLLLLAGLLTAVVTAFTIESYKWLQPDPSDVTNNLLLRISNHLSNSSLPAADDTNNTPFTPSSSVLLINAVWFLSIVLGLSVALVGLLCKQWIQSYKKYPAVKPRVVLGIRQKRYDELQKWKLPDIITSLPILLEMSVVLFFVGILVLLLERSTAVAIPCAVAVGLTLAFVGFTTILPAGLFLIDWIRSSTSGGHSRSPNFRTFSPFKSPQSWILLFTFVQLRSIPSQTLRTFAEGWITLERQIIQRNNVSYTKDCLVWVILNLRRSFFVETVYNAMLEVEQNPFHMGLGWVKDPLFLGRLSRRMRSELIKEVQAILHDVSLRHNVQVIDDHKYAKFLENCLSWGNVLEMDEAVVLSILNKMKLMLAFNKTFNIDDICSALPFVYALSSHRSEAVQETLVELSRQNHLWLASMHDPRSDVLRLITKLYNLTSRDINLNEDPFKSGATVSAWLKFVERCRLAAGLSEEQVSSDHQLSYAETKGRAIIKYSLEQNYFNCIPTVVDGMRAILDRSPKT